MRVQAIWYTEALLAAAMIAGSASATTVTFTLGDSPAGNTNPFSYHHSSSFSVMSDGYTLTFSNPGGAPHQNSVTQPSTGAVGSDSMLPDNELAFERDSYGLTIGNWLWHTFGNGEKLPFPGYTNSFTMTLSGPTDLVLTDYTINWVDLGGGAPGDFTLTQNTAAVSTGNGLDTLGTFGIGGGPAVWQNGTSMEFLAAAVDEYSLITLESFTFEISAVPGAGLAGLATVGLVGVSRQRRREVAVHSHLVN